MDEMIINMTRELNEKEYLNNVKVPILDGFQVVPNEGPLFTAVDKDFSIEQFLTDGILEEGDTFLGHVSLVVQDIAKTMKEAGLLNVLENIQFYEDYQTKDFQFKVYVQDNIYNEKVIRQFNMFFMDPEYNAFYQLSLATPTYPISEIEYVRGDLTTNLVETIHNLMNHVTH